MHPVHITWNFYFFNLISSNFRSRWWITAKWLLVCCQTYLMTHSNITKNMRYQERYNTALCRTRVLVEQTYGILKRKFPCFAVSLRTDQGRVCQYVVSCMVLHCVGTLRHDIFTLSLDDLTIAGPDNQDIADPANHNGFRYRKFIVGQCFDHWTILVKTFISDKINMFSITCIFRIKRSLFLTWIYFPFGAFVFLS